MVAGSKTVVNAIQWRVFKVSKMPDLRRFILLGHFSVRKNRNGRHSIPRFFE